MKEEKGEKTQIKIQMQMLSRVTPEGARKWGRKANYKALVGRFQHSQFVNVTSIDCQEKLVDWIYHNYSYGLWNVLVWRLKMRNKSFRPWFRCSEKVKENCLHYKKGKCRVYSRHTNGWSCKKNPKWINNWSIYAKVLIEPADSLFGEIEYKYTWFKSNDKMQKYWFWKKSRPSQNNGLIS